ncbi:hypothetical protein QGM71_19580 [Virgibacillus sp. C22-A2]|uniref:Uncharacterized protein n=1 Tax=Virgibacillus tibetensis TaxID=3042313 RepID=A0ABU6KMC6_9BACI|nr:hypothetical protein [Virgibacillus sp. C22-A2]
MKGKLIVLLILLATIAVLIFCWIWLQEIIEEYDIDRALSESVEINI